MQDKKKLLAPILIMAIGFAWLLNVYEVIPGVDWLWTGSLALVGVLLLVLGPINRLTVTIGPFLIIGSVFSILRQTGRMSVDVEIPLLVILFGALLLIAHLLKFPMPRFVEDEQNPAA